MLYAYRHITNTNIMSLYMLNAYTHITYNKSNEFYIYIYIEFNFLHHVINKIVNLSVIV